MAQNRDAPAYQEYAASVLALARFKELTLAEKGLLYLMKMECWINISLPTDIKKLSKTLGQEHSEVNELLPQVMPFFKIELGRIINPELEFYRAHLLAIKEHRKKGADATNAIKSKKKSDAQANAQAKNERSYDMGLSGNSANAENTLASIGKSSQVQVSQIQPCKEDYENPFGDDFGSAYDKASNGE